MTRRIRDFMTNNNSTEISNDQSQDLDINRNFSVALEKCEPSSVSMVNKKNIQINTLKEIFEFL